MDYNEAEAKATEILRRKPLTVADGEELIALEQYLDPEISGDLWEAFIASAPFEVIMQIG